MALTHCHKEIKKWYKQRVLGPSVTYKSRRPHMVTATRACQWRSLGDWLSDFQSNFSKTFPLFSVGLCSKWFDWWPRKGQHRGFPDISCWYSLHANLECFTVMFDIDYGFCMVQVLFLLSLQCFVVIWISASGWNIVACRDLRWAALGFLWMDMDFIFIWWCVESFFVAFEHEKRGGLANLVWSMCIHKVSITLRQRDCFLKRLLFCIKIPVTAKKLLQKGQNMLPKATFYENQPKPCKTIQNLLLFFIFFLGYFSVWPMAAPGTLGHDGILWRRGCRGGFKTEGGPTEKTVFGSLIFFSKRVITQTFDVKKKNQ